MTMLRFKSISAHGVAVLFAIVFAVSTLSPAPAAIGQSVRCFDDWSDAAPIVLNERLVPARELQAWARKKLKSKVIRVTLCQDGERYIYRVLVRGPKGRIRNRTVEARGPLEQNDPPPKAAKPAKSGKPAKQTKQ